MSLDQRVGTDGFRNRSDVVRESVRRFLTTTDISSHTVELKIGADLSRTLNRFCALRGEDLASVLQSGARMYMQKEIAASNDLDRAIEARVEDVANRQDDDSLTP
ncbi:MAG TPA: hypothetical protein HA247_00030 [Candidatus Thalassarchaeaceae archaeon]|nr:hypothetical protein [Candidatus Thalassarchaeaceae archaeon]